MDIEQLSHELKYENKWMKVYEDRILRSNGKEGIYGVVEKNDFSLIVPFDGKGFYLVEQYRYPLKVRSLEFPMGCFEADDKDSYDGAKRELQEECGLLAENFEYIGTFYTAVGFSNQKGHVFLAKELSETSNSLDEEECDLVRKYFLMEDFVKLIEDNTVKDSATICAWEMVKGRL